MKRKLLSLFAFILLATGVGWTQINSLTTLQKAITDAKAGATITLTDNITDSGGDTIITIDKSITLQGKEGTTPFIQMKGDKNAFLINTTDGNVVFKNLQIRGDKAAASGKQNSIGIAFPNENKFAGSLTLDGVTIQDFFFGINCCAVAASSAAPKNTISIKGCKFIECLHKAVYTENSEITIENTTIEKCATQTKVTSQWLTAVAVDINLKYGTYDKATVTGCTFTDNGTQTRSLSNEAIVYSTALGVKARNDGTTYGANPATLKEAVVSGNTFTNNYQAIQLGEPQANKANELTKIVLADNTFSGNQNDIINSSTNTTVASVVGNVKGVGDALKFCVPGSTITLKEGIYPYASTLRIEKSLTITGSGDNTILKPTSEFNKGSGDGGDRYLITVYGGKAGDKEMKDDMDVTLKNFLIDGTDAKEVTDYRGGLNIALTEQATLENITSKNGRAAGLVVNSSNVIAKGLKTENNPWGGVNVSKGSNYTNKPSFTFDATCSFAEMNKVYSELEDVVTCPDDTWMSYKIGDQTIWTNDIASTLFVSPNGTGDGTERSKPTTLANALARQGVTNIQVLVGTYTLANPDSVILSKSITITGDAKDACIIKGKWAIAPADTADIVLKNLTLTEAATTATDSPIIGVKTSKVNLQLIDVAINMEAVGIKNYAAIRIAAEGVTSSTVSLDKTVITLKQNNQIGFYNDGGLCHFKMVDSKITHLSSANLSGVKSIVTLGADGSTFDVKRSVLTVGSNYHYAIWIKSSKQHFRISDSTVEGWSVFYVQGAHVKGGTDGVTLESSNTSFTGIGKAGASNGFGVIVFEGTRTSSVKLTNCTVTSKIFADTESFGFIPPVVFQRGGANAADRTYMGPSENCLVVFDNCTVRNIAEATTPIMVSYNNLATADQGKFDPYKNKVTIINKTKMLNADGTNSILVQHGDTLRNATKLISTAITYKEGEIAIPVAYTGDEILTAQKSALVLAGLNATDAIPLGYAVPDSIVINCADAYLVSGNNDEAAKAFAEGHGDKVVFWLKHDRGVFSTVSVGNIVKEITTDTTWGDNAFANRSVKIRKGATLTINVSMPLDTLFMEEGAQLVTDYDVNVKALQLTNYTPGVNKWKAFGFPAAIGTVKDAKGTAVSPVAADAAAGVWLAELKAEAAPTFEVKTNGFASACILAADKESALTVTTQAALSVKTKAEPSAPVAAEAATSRFVLHANPNLYAMTLTQTAYVLSADGTSYERKENPVIPAFGSFMLADVETTQKLRSLRVGGTPTSNELAPASDYAVRTERGTIVVLATQPVVVSVVAINGVVYYNKVVSGGEVRISVPSGVYAVNKQLVVVK